MTAERQRDFGDHGAKCLSLGRLGIEIPRALAGAVFVKPRSAFAFEAIMDRVLGFPTCRVVRDIEPTPAVVLHGLLARNPREVLPALRMEDDLHSARTELAHAALELAALKKLAANP